MRFLLSLLTMLVLAGVIGLATAWYKFGSVQPCEILRVQVRDTGIKTGGLFGAIAGVVPDSLVDGIIISVIGSLTPQRCLNAILDRRFEKPYAAIPTRAEGTPTQTLIPTKTPCLSDSCQQIGEAAGKQAYDSCAAMSSPDKLNNGRLNKCHTAALDAWIATGALAPYAHPCPIEGAKVDFVGRCK